MLNNNSLMDEIVPFEFFLSQNYPNPFKEKTVIKYCVAYKTRVQIAVYDHEEKAIEKLVDEEKQPGTYEIKFNASVDHFGNARNLSNGYYFYRMFAGDFSSEKKWLCINNLLRSNTMKTFLQTLFFFLLVTQICFAQWELQNPLITQNNLNDVTLIDENTGWAVGDSGTIIKTTNAGIDWLAQESNTTYQLRGVCFVNENYGWVVGGSGIILSTTNGGITWTQFISGITDNLNDVSFVNENVGLAVGENGRVMKTNDGGNTWVAQMLGNTNTLYGVCFVDNNNGWIVGENYPDGVIKRTTDGGNTWNTQLSPINIHESLYDLYFTDINTGWIVGRNHNGTDPWGEILKTTNGGSSWIEQSCPTQAELSSVHFIDSNNGWATAADRWYGGIKGHILRTTNGGATWLIQYLGVSKATNGIFFTNPNNGTAVGENGTIQLSTDGGNTWNSPPGGSTNDWTDVSFTDPNNGMVIGDGGTILRTTNGGISWTPVFTGTTNDFTAMSFIDANEGWAVTGIIRGFHTELRDSSFIFHTTDGGVTWTKQLTMPLTLFNDVSFVDANNGWAVGVRTDSIWWTSEYWIILRTNNGGTTWTQTLTDTIWGSKIFFADMNTGWIISTSIGMGSTSCIYKTIDGGNTWGLQFEIGSRWGSHLKDIVFLDSNIGIAVGRSAPNVASNYALIVKTTDGGVNWTQILIDPPALNGVFFTNAMEGTAVGEEGVIHRTSDGGTSWEAQTSGTTNSLNNVYFTDALNGWISSNNGIILHTTNGGVSFVEEEQIDEVPTTYSLSNNFPNPFNPSTKIKYSVPQSSNVVMKVFDVLGNEIENLVSEEKPAGTYEITWNAENLPSGVYFYQLRAGDYIAVKKMLLLK